MNVARRLVKQRKATSLPPHSFTVRSASEITSDLRNNNNSQECPSPLMADLPESPAWQGMNQSMSLWVHSKPLCLPCPCCSYSPCLLLLVSGPTVKLLCDGKAEIGEGPFYELETNQPLWADIRDFINFLDLEKKENRWKFGECGEWWVSLIGVSLSKPHTSE